MERTTSRDYALLILRLSGLYLAFGHGWAKFSALVTGAGDGVIDTAARLGFPVPTFFGWALGCTEFIGGLCIAIGLATRAFASLAAFAMFVAASLRHRALTQFLTWVGIGSASPEELRGYGDPERAILFLLIFLALIVLGPGRLSLERWLRERRR